MLPMTASADNSSAEQEFPEHREMVLSSLNTAVQVLEDSNHTAVSSV